MSRFDLTGRVAVVTGGTGVLGGALARGLAEAGAKVGILGRRTEKAEEVAGEIQKAGGEALPLTADVLDRVQLERARDAVLDTWSRVDILVNAAGGNQADATVVGDRTFFGLSQGALEGVLALNLLGTVLPSQVFGEAMVAGGGASSTSPRWRQSARSPGWSATARPKPRSTTLRSGWRWSWPTSTGRACA